ncbi:hypothetical protein M513_07415 [Trichuris suis]|uniref:Glycosyl transferase CAP10 domain-containing protein n=1 Tax=Trichuris suis TaxID=68888 RepID=A0A085M3C3_9BILA|nr:hypothetical protein M513_07415 [Trichuris suis]
MVTLIPEASVICARVSHLRAKLPAYQSFSLHMDRMRICLLLFIVVLTVIGEDVCTNEDECANVANTDRYDRFAHYRDLITRGLRNNVDCAAGSCHCYDDQIDRNLRPFEEGIVKDMLPYGGRHVLYQIVDHKLYRSANCTFEARCSGVEHFLLKIVDQLPDVEFFLNDHDYPFISTYAEPKMVVFSFSTVVMLMGATGKDELTKFFLQTKDFLDIMYPAWSFWKGGPAIAPYPTGIGRWDLLRTTLSKEAAMWPWEMKKSKGFFRGSRTNKNRDPLILLSRRRPDLSSTLQYVGNTLLHCLKDTLGMKAVKELPFEYNCRFKYLFNSAGVAASFRLRHLFLCRSLVFHIGDEWQEFFYSQLKPWVHYIPVKDDLSNVEELLQFARENDELVKQIADRGYNFIWDHLRMEDVECYWKTLLTRYATLLRFKVVKNPELMHVVGR